jgi:hypothetical protein
VLFVVRPNAAADPTAVDAVLRNMRAAASFRWKTAVLAPDGSLSSFFGSPVNPDAQLAALRAALTHAVGSGQQPSHASPSIADWTKAERAAFRQLQARSGRHVIVELVSSPAAHPPSDPGPRADADAFDQDRTLDLVARDDMAQIYRLAAPTTAVTGQIGVTQSNVAHSNLTHSNKEQHEATGGSTGQTVDELFRAIVNDAPGSYDLVVHPLFSCQPGTAYSLGISTSRPDTQLFYPSTIRMAADTPN